MSSVLSALVAYYPAIINKMPAQFTAHQFIQSLMQQYQALYIEALYNTKIALNRSRWFMARLGVICMTLKNW